MYLQDEDWLEAFWMVLKRLGVKEPIASDSEFSPKYIFKYGGANFWIYKDDEGYTVFSDPSNAVQELNKIWQQVLAENQESEENDN